MSERERLSIESHRVSPEHEEKIHIEIAMDVERPSGGQVYEDET